MIKRAQDRAFQKAIYASIIAHVAVFVLILVSPSLPKPSRKGMIHYIPLNMLSTAGGGGDGKPAGAGPPATSLKKETIRDLTTAQKLAQDEKSSLRYPVNEPKKEAKAKPEKKAAITKPEPVPPEKAAAGTTTEGLAAGTGSGGFGTGLRIGGTGNGTGGPGFGSGLGLANFPYTYYLNIITERVSTNWFTALVDPGVSGNFQTVIFFKIQRDGQVADLKIEQSSGATPLDLSALRAVRASAPFPPLPRDYEDAYLTIHLIFEHSK